MAEEPDNLVLVALREQRDLMNRIHNKLDDMQEDMREVKTRLSAVEMQVSTLHNRMDRFDERLARVERRLDLVDA